MRQGAMAALGTSRLARLVQARPSRPPDDGERCDLCGEPLAGAHRHLLELEARALRCACRACATLFDRRAAGGGHFRLVPERCRFVVDLALDGPAWAQLGVPVDVAFFVPGTRAARVRAFYPSPVGATDWTIAPEAWAAVAAANPVLASLDADVEALLVNRVAGAHQHWLAPLDACYALVGLMRRHWRGLGGGAAVWAELGRFFAALRERALAVDRHGRAAPDDQRRCS